MFDYEAWKVSWDAMLALWDEAMKAENEPQMTRLIHRATTAEGVLLWQVVYAVASGVPKDVIGGLKAAKVACGTKAASGLKSDG